MKEFRILQICIFGLFLGGCSSPAEKVSDAIANGDLVSAEQVLRAEGALSLDTSSLDPELIEARRVFEISVVAHTRSQVEEFRQVGSLRLARDTSEEASLRCPWSTELERLVEECRSDVLLFEDLLARWSGKSALVKASITSSREFLNDAWRVRGAVLHDRSLRDIAVEACLKDAEALMPSTRQELRESEGAALRNYLRSQHFIRWVPQSVESGLTDLFDRVIGAMSLNSLGDCVNLLGYSNAPTREDEWYSAAHSRLVTNLQLRFKAWFDGFVTDHLAEIASDSTFSDASIQSFSNARGWVSPESLARVCAARAESLSAGGDLALAAVYWQLASEVSQPDSIYHESFRSIVDEVRSLGLLEYTYSVDFGTSIDPELLSIVVPLVWSTVSAAGAPSFWTPTSRGDEPEVQINVSRAELVVPETRNLLEVSSSHYSHQETVRNPDLNYLESRVSSTRSSMNFAESMYNSAVSSFNFNPTQWNLNAANSAYTSYSIAVNSYNAAVRAYNRAPATVQRPVYVPYQFSEGTLEYGWRFTAEITVNGSTQMIDSSQLNSQFVRIGASRLDRDQSRRANQPLPNFTADEIVSSLISATEDCLHEMATRLEGELLQIDSKRLSSGEAMALRTLLMPLNSARTSSEGEWRRGRGPRPKLLLPPNGVSSSGFLMTHAAKRVRAEIAAEEDVRRVDLSASSNALQSSQPREFTCQISSGFSQGIWTSFQSGALVSADGYILTCAHGLVGERHQVTMPTSGVELSARLIRVDRTIDVALLKVEPAESGVPFARLAPATGLEAGDLVRASGFPSTLSAGSGFALASGSFLGLASEDPSQMILDLTVSSGSSGGPILNGGGEVIGITLAVGSPSLGDATGVASSGYVAVARGVGAALSALVVEIE